MSFDGRIAAISDIHGNRWALEAVLEEIDRRNVGIVANLGDVYYGPLDPSGTAEILSRREMIAVLGNEDRMLFDPSEHSPTLAFTRSMLSEGDISRLRALEAVRSLGAEILMFHGTPADDRRYLLHAVRDGGIARRAPEEIAAEAGGGPESLVLCGHDHVPNAIRWKGKTFANPGSVGLQAYADDLPERHRVETGGPEARCCVIETSPSGWIVELVAVPYDHRSAAEAAERNGRPDWAHWLRTGRAE